MKAKVLGKRPLDFSTNDGKRVQGTQIFVAYKDTNPKSETEGELTEKLFIPVDSDVQIPRFNYGEEYDFVYETVGFGSKARSVLKKILDKNGKECKADPFAAILP